MFLNNGLFIIQQLSVSQSNICCTQFFSFELNMFEPIRFYCIFTPIYIFHFMLRYLAFYLSVQQFSKVLCHTQFFSFEFNVWTTVYPLPNHIFIFYARKCLWAIIYLSVQQFPVIPSKFPVIHRLPVQPCHHPKEIIEGWWGDWLENISEFHWSVILGELDVIKSDIKNRFDCNIGFWQNVRLECGRMILECERMILECGRM